MDYSREEHDEFAKRIEESQKRQNHQLEKLEATVKEIGQLTNSVNKLAINMELMLKEQTEQNERLKVLESQDGEMWRKVISYLVTAIVGVAVGVVAKQLGF